MNKELSQRVAELNRIIERARANGFDRMVECYKQVRDLLIIESVS